MLKETSFFMKCLSKRLRQQALQIYAKRKSLENVLENNKI